MTYLIGALVLSAVLAWVVVWWHRRPKSMEQAIDEFSAGLNALAPRDDAKPGDRRSASMRSPRPRRSRREPGR